MEFSHKRTKIIKKQLVTFDNNEDEWIYSRKTNVIFNAIGEQIGHMVFPFHT